MYTVHMQSTVTELWVPFVFFRFQFFQLLHFFCNLLLVSLHLSHPLLCLTVLLMPTVVLGLNLNKLYNIELWGIAILDNIILLCCNK